METKVTVKISYQPLQFKSYYVVWKLANKPIAVSKGFCLNRTMQYGNITHLIQIKSTDLWFKSYYVVWKPL